MNDYKKIRTLFENIQNIVTKIQRINKFITNKSKK